MHTEVKFSLYDLSNSGYAMIAMFSASLWIHNLVFHENLHDSSVADWRSHSLCPLIIVSVIYPGHMPILVKVWERIRHFGRLWLCCSKGKIPYLLLFHTTFVLAGYTILLHIVIVFGILRLWFIKVWDLGHAITIHC